MATSVAAKGYVLLALAKGEPIPPGWAQDKLGRPTTDAHAAAEGTMLPMAQHKGYALALMIDVLCGVLTGASFGQLLGSLTSDYSRGQDVGHLGGAIDIAHFLPLEQFYGRLETMVQALKASPLAEGFEQILVPGEPEEMKRQRRLRNGVPIPEPIRRDFRTMGERLGVPFA
jgi:LDH2 family malate/lactate/ureidoglycolate dehydrogenase